MTNIQNLRTTANRLSADYEFARRQCRDERDALAAAETRVESTREAQELIQAVAQTIQQTAHRKIAAVVTKCLDAVFGDAAYVFKIHFDRKRGKTEARLVLTRGETELDPIDSVGGGVVDVTVFALRIASLVLSQPALRRLVVADEPFRMLSAEYRPAVAAMIETLARELKIQFILVTHSPELQIGSVVRL